MECESPRQVTEPRAQPSPKENRGPTDGVRVLGTAGEAQSLTGPTEHPGQGPTAPGPLRSPQSCGLWPWCRGPAQMSTPGSWSCVFLCKASPPPYPPWSRERAKLLAPGRPLEQEEGRPSAPQQQEGSGGCPLLSKLAFASLCLFLSLHNRIHKGTSVEGGPSAPR